MYTVQAIDPRMNILLYGPPGVGKTWLASTAQDHPKMANVMYLNVEGGLLTVASRGDIKAIDIIAIERFKSTPDMPSLPENQSTLEDEFWKLANKQDADYASIRTVVIDSGSECQTLNLECIVQAALRAGKNKNRVDQDDIWQEDYGKSTNQLKRLFRWFRDLDVNVVITALPATVYPKKADNQQNTNADPIDVRPQFTAKLSEAVMGYVDFVWYLFEDENGQRSLLTKKTGVYRAKTRGIKFAEALGAVVPIKDENDPKSKGYDLADIYDLYMEIEGPKSKKPAQKK